MKRINISFIITLLLAMLLNACTHKKSERNVLNLAGEWSVQLDPEDVGIKDGWNNKTLQYKMQLPGTTDEAGLGEAEKYTDPYNALVRPHYYVGKAWYQKEIEIPENWSNKHFILVLERCHWVTKVWVDTQYAGSQNSLCTAQEYDLSEFLVPGKHKITVCVDNKYPFSLGAFASSVSEHTQSNWNGIVGRIELQALDPVYLDDLRIYPDVKNKEVKITANIHNKTGALVDATVDVITSLLEDGSNESGSRVSLQLNKEVYRFETTIFMGENVQLWDEFSPHLYRIKAQLKTKEYYDVLTDKFGMREVGVDHKIFTINGKRTYMRGNLECCVFPLTGYPPTTVDGWMKEMQQMKDYGLNHIRFHSWCPPKAAFDAADIVGMYIQAEAPRANVGADQVRDSFILNELFRINRAYGNNPSFMFMTGGNELAEDAQEDQVNVDMIAEAMKDDNRHLYSTTSGGRGMDHKESRNKVDQYRVGGARGFHHAGTNEDWGEYYTGIKFASVTHEVGQWASYPSLLEIPKYTGVLQPVNLLAIRNDLKAKGMLDLAKTFTDATTRHAATLYKEEVEVLMRSQDNSGFQLLSLHDYPGQGTAHVGLFDSFWDNKGGITKEGFRKFCSPVTPLLRMDKRTYSNDEVFSASAELLHYGPKTFDNTNVVWSISDQKATVLKQGKFAVSHFPQGERTQLGEIKAELNFVNSATKLTVHIAVEGTPYQNDWEIWCYPKAKAEAWPTEIVVCNTLDTKAAVALNKGETVLILPKAENLTRYLPGNPKTVFWSPTWWWTRTRRGNITMSILCDPQHPVFKNFPTEYHSNWQWWNLQRMSNSVILDTLPHTITPIVRVIDNYSSNHKLGNLIEAKVGKGKVMICSMDLESKLESRPEAIQLRNSILAYMQSNKFKPTEEIALDNLKKLFK